MKILHFLILLLLTTTNPIALGQQKYPNKKPFADQTEKPMVIINARRPDRGLEFAGAFTDTVVGISPDHWISSRKNTNWQWVFRAHPAGDGSFRIHPNNDMSQCLTGVWYPDGWDTVQTMNCSATLREQTWYLQKTTRKPFVHISSFHQDSSASDSMYMIRNADDGKCLTMRDYVGYVKAGTYECERRLDSDFDNRADRWVIIQADTAKAIVSDSWKKWADKQDWRKNKTITYWRSPNWSNHSSVDAFTLSQWADTHALVQFASQQDQSQSPSISPYTITNIVPGKISTSKTKNLVMNVKFDNGDIKQCNYSNSPLRKEYSYEETWQKSYTWGFSNTHTVTTKIGAEWDEFLTTEIAYSYSFANSESWTDTSGGKWGGKVRFTIGPRSCIWLAREVKSKDTAFDYSIYTDNGERWMTQKIFGTLSNVLRGSNTTFTLCGTGVKNPPKICQDTRPKEMAYQ